jgi:hypothetical protein
MKGNETIDWKEGFPHDLSLGHKPKAKVWKGASWECNPGV